MTIPSGGRESEIYDILPFSLSFFISLISSYLWPMCVWLDCAHGMRNDDGGGGCPKCHRWWWSEGPMTMKETWLYSLNDNAQH